MQEILVVVDMQNDFVTGPLGTPEARTILPKVAEKVKNFPGRVLFTRDTHEENYLESREGKALPVPHCIRGTRGWEICPELETLRKEEPVDKPTFGSTGLGEVLRAADQYGERSGRSPLSASAPISVSSRMPCSCGPSCRKRRSRSTPPAAPG